MTIHVFIIFILKDAEAAQSLITEIKDRVSNIEFTLMSHPQKDDELKANKSAIESCDGAIALISENTGYSNAVRWTLKQIFSASVPLLGVYVQDKVPLPMEIIGYRVVNWDWEIINRFLLWLEQEQEIIS